MPACYHQWIGHKLHDATYGQHSCPGRVSGQIWPALMYPFRSGSGIAPNLALAELLVLLSGAGLAIFSRLAPLRALIIFRL